MTIRNLMAVALAFGLAAGTAAARAAELAPVSLARIGANIPNGAKWGRVQTRSFPLPCTDHDALIWDAKNNEAIENADFERLFRQELAASGYSVTGDPTNLFESDTKTAEFQVGALVTGIDARFCAQRTIWDERLVISGQVAMQVEWQVYSTLRARVVARIPTTGSYASEKALDAGNIVMLQGAFTENVKKLAATGEFRRILSGGAAAAVAARQAEPMSLRLGRSTRRSPAEAATAVALIFAGSSQGSGFLISPDGYLLTNSHVVGDAARVRVRWSDQSETVGQVLRTDPRRDVALVKVDPSSRLPLGLRGGAPGLGEPVFAVGTPLNAKFQGTVTKGIISSHRTYDGQAFIQSDVSINPGNSGGPLLDENGAVVGLAVSGYRIGDAPTGLNLFIPIGAALEALALTPAS